MNRPWKVTAEKVQAVVDGIVELSQPRKIILFGSYVRGDAHSESDLDVLVVTAAPIENPRKESVRIRRGLRGINMSMDILVVPEDRLRELADVPGLIYREILRSGRVVYESAA